MFPLLLAATLALAACASAEAGDRIVTASERGTYIEIGRDLARLVAAPAGVELEVLSSRGSADNVQRLRSEPGVRLALVQSDVYRAFLDRAARGDSQAAHLIEPLRVVMPLYEEEIYFVVRADSPLHYVHEMRGKRINVGLLGSGTALTATTIYASLFGSQLDAAHSSFLSSEESLVKLTSDRSIDVAVVVAGQPTRLFAEMKPEARQYIRLLAVDSRDPQTQRLLSTYNSVMVRAGSYPTWLQQDVPALAVRSLLVTYDYQVPETRNTLIRIARSLCQRFDALKEEGHVKWREVNLGQPDLGAGWRYYAPTHRVLSDCIAQRSPEVFAQPARAASSPDSVCPQQRAVLGLCRVR